MRVHWGWMLLLLGACAAVLLVPDRASAAVSTSVVLTPSTTTVTVGDVGVPESVLLTNTSTAPDTITTVCNDDDPDPCRSDGEGMRFNPSCGEQPAGSGCSGPDAGVFQANAGTGGAGTVCANFAFDMVPSAFLFDPLFGLMRVVPRDAHVPFGGAGSTCRIDFSVDVLRLPTRDLQPTVPGLQTEQIFTVTVRSSVTNHVSSDRGISVPITVAPAPEPQTAITAGVAEGGTTDDATPTFEFVSSRPKSTFGCSIDGSSPFPCVSPYTSVPLTPGTHVFTVAATAFGVTDPTPATRTFVYQVPGAAQVTPPSRVAITTRSARVGARGAVVVGLRCTAGSGACTGRLVLSRTIVVRCAPRRTCRRTLVLATRTFSVGSSRTAALRMTVTPRGRSLLAGARLHRLAVAAKATTPTNVATRTLTLLG